PSKTPQASANSRATSNASTPTSGRLTTAGSDRCSSAASPVKRNRPQRCVKSSEVSASRRKRRPWQAVGGGSELSPGPKTEGSMAETALSDTARELFADGIDARVTNGGEAKISVEQCAEWRRRVRLHARYSHIADDE